MARKVSTVTIGAEGNRDAGKVFQLTEMSAAQAESWAARMLLAIGRSGAQVPETLFSAGLAGLAKLGPSVLIGLAWSDLEPLLAEMMACVVIVPSPSQPAVTRKLLEDDIEEITTRLRLRTEVWKLHVGFSTAGNPPA